MKTLDNLSKQFNVCDSDESLDAESATDCKKCLKSLRTSNPDKRVFAHLNINSIKNKFEILSDQINPLSDNSTKWPNTLKQFVGNLPTNCLSVFDHFVKLALKGLKAI